MPSQTESGKAFEYALACSMYRHIKKKQSIEFKKNTSYNVALKSFDLFNVTEQEKYNWAADAAVKHILYLEPRLNNPPPIDAKLTIQIQSDQKGVAGDVRDVVIISSESTWQIGFSAKNNHNAVKHSRLSDRINFGKDWFDVPCSATYMDEVKQIFGKLRNMVKNDSGIEWNQIINKQEDYYLPVLESFKKEIWRLSWEHDEISRRLIEYLVGKHDFYKIMKFDNFVRIQGYNLYGTLNKPSYKQKPERRVQKMTFPTEIIQAKITGNNTLTMTFDKGWALSFRIHNARTKVEPSLKFDVQLVGIPNNMYDDREWGEELKRPTM